MIVLSAAIAVSGCRRPPPPPRLDAPAWEDRVRAIYRLDREGILEHIDELYALAGSDPSRRVRDEAMVHLAYVGDPSFVAFAEFAWGTPSQYGAFAALTLHPAGCPAVARWYGRIERRSDGSLADPAWYDPLMARWERGRCDDEVWAVRKAGSPDLRWYP